MSDFILTQEEIDRLLLGRNVYDEYKLKLANNPLLKNEFRQDLGFELAKLNFLDHLSFKEINKFYNIIEFDDCYRVRHKDKPNTVNMEVDDFCIQGSGCKKRGYPPCAHELNMSVVICANNLSANKFLPRDKSKICNEHKTAAELLGLDTSKLYTPYPLMLIGCYKSNPEFLAPIFCEGICVKIKEPRFDVFWGMEDYFSVAVAQDNLRKKMYEEKK
jgi:hypothetical protein